MPWIPHNDAAARAIFQRFKDVLEPAMADIAPDWLLHHIKMERRQVLELGNEEVRIQLVLRPIGIARDAQPADDPIQEHRAGRPPALPWRE